MNRLQESSWLRANLHDLGRQSSYWIGRANHLSMRWQRRHQPGCRVVTGANAEQVQAVVNDLDVIVVRNEEWKSGQGALYEQGLFPTTASTTPTAPFSAQRRVEGLAEQFSLVDQPQITTSILRFSGETRRWLTNRGADVIDRRVRLV
jgi:hypothetical protein